VYYNGAGIQYGDVVVNSNASARYIPAMQGFFVKANAVAPSFTIPETPREHNSNPMFKSEEKGEKRQFDYIKLSLSGGPNAFTDETVVRYLEEAQPEFDSEYDAYKMFPWGDVIPMLYSVTEAQLPLAINSMPLSDFGTTVPLGIKIGSTGDYKFTVKEFSFPYGSRVILADKATETELELSEGDEFTFRTQNGDIRDRFYLFYLPNNTLDDNDIEKSEPVKIWANQKELNFTVESKTLELKSVDIYNMLGELVLRKQLQGMYGNVQMTTTGIYLVKLNCSNGLVQNQKVIIR